MSAMSIAISETESSAVAMPAPPRLNLLEALRAHWPEYLMEAAGLGICMIAACIFGALYEFPGSPVRQAIGSLTVRRILMGISMGATALAIVHSPWGKQSGAHINPSVTFTYLRLGKVRHWDAVFYVAAQFIGAVAGVFLIALVLGRAVADPAVRYLVTVPGPGGVLPAWAGEFAMATGMMSVILYFSNHHRFDGCTGLFTALRATIYITIAAPFTRPSLNPARSLGSALNADIWRGLWIYLTASPLGMLLAAECYLLLYGKQAVKCCKLHHQNNKRCIFCGANGGFSRPGKAA